jgi:hypothetical protein
MKIPDKYFTFASQLGIDPADIVRLDKFKYIREDFPLSCLQIYESPFSKIRLGKQNDGGYIIADIDNYDNFLSCGVKDDISFEEAFIEKYKNVCTAFDHSIDNLPTDNKKIIFIKKQISDVNSDTEENLHNYIMNLNNIFLKMDIEGDEYLWLNTLTEQQLSKFKQIAIEFHEPYDKIKWRMIEKINKTHYAIHFHHNNCSAICNFNNLIMPENFEMTFIRKTEFKNKPELNKDSFPTILDQPNDLMRPIYFFNKYPFVKND